jgi:hypothetical protein
MRARDARERVEAALDSAAASKPPERAVDGTMRLDLLD